MGRLASQTAAHKLWYILGVLVIPIAVLLSLYLYEAKGRIDQLTRAQSGMDLASLVARGEVSPETIATRFAHLNLPADFSTEANRDRSAALFEILRSAGVDRHVDAADRNLLDAALAMIAKPAPDASPALVAAFSAVQQSLSRSKSGLWRNLVLLTFAGFASAVSGIGLAVLMMRSTFARLDDLEQAQKEAQDARREAELLAMRYSNINSDISLLNQELAFKVKELATAQDELIKRGRMEQLGQLTATIAHEIRNPLGAIRTSAFLLQRKTANLGADLSGHLQRINNGVDRCDTIISQLLDFSRTKEVNSTLALLDEWVLKIVRDEAQRLPPSVTIECALGLEEIKVPFDPQRLQRALINVINNASEALGQGEADSQGGKPQTKSPSIVITTLRLGDDVGIRVADNGPGMTPDVLARIREPLFTTKSFGTGLGLPAVEQIMLQHKGRIEITSEPGRGTVTTLILPFLNRQEPRDAA